MGDQFYDYKAGAFTWTD